ncbi:MAG TPA: iron-containing alcohol dehydrogenase [Elusimicrobiota bacterium]|nr:iron-containing alcohol dehydrogenase [Elusimicrobiota bacterium]
MPVTEAGLTCSDGDARSGLSAFDLGTGEWLADPELGNDEAGLHGRAFVVSDTAVGPLFAHRAEAVLKAAGYTAETLEVPAGEEHKTLATVGMVYDWLISHRVERSDFVVCVGGGVVTDLAGFAAATCLRGIPFVHVPTSLLAMADASIGGKTGVDHARGKNLIGAFAQPKAVLIDPRLLKSLPARFNARVGEGRGRAVSRGGVFFVFGSGGNPPGPERGRARKGNGPNGNSD